MNSYKNSESIHWNSYTWIHILMNSYIHFTYEFTCIWIHIIISYMNSYNDFMNSHVYEFTCMNSYIWIHETYEFVYEIWIHSLYEFMYELGCTKVPDAHDMIQHGAHARTGIWYRFTWASPLLTNVKPPQPDVAGTGNLKPCWLGWGFNTVKFNVKFNLNLQLATGHFNFALRHHDPDYLKFTVFSATAKQSTFPIENVELSC